jgi:hypothetical protein
VAFRLQPVAATKEGSNVGFLNDVYRCCGLFWSAALVFSTAAVFTIGVLLLVLVRSRAVFLVFLVLAFIPLAVGFLGTLDHYRIVYDVIRRAGVSPTPEELTIVHRSAWMTTWVGAAGTASLVLMAMVGLAAKRRKKTARPVA